MRKRNEQPGLDGDAGRRCVDDAEGRKNDDVQHLRRVGLLELLAPCSRVGKGVPS